MTDATTLHHRICPLCEACCGLEIKVRNQQVISIRGHEADVFSAGYICPKGVALKDLHEDPDRLRTPLIKRNGQLEPATWDEAFAEIERRLPPVQSTHGRNAVGLVAGNPTAHKIGLLLYLPRLLKALGTHNFFSAATLDQIPRHLVSGLMYGGWMSVPVPDIARTQWLLVLGANPVASNGSMWTVPDFRGKAKALRARGGKLVVIDPRRTETAERADLHLAIKPDGDVALFQGLLATMRHRGKLDEVYLANHVSVPENFWDDICCSDIAGATGLDQDVLAEFYGLFEEFPRTVTLFSQGSNQSACGTDKGNAIINVHLATGRIGKPGAGPFSMTGQPNAMGGREVGGLANMLAAHMGFSDEERAAAQDFWASPTIAPGPGLKAVDMFKAVHDGRIKALWIMATNPAVSMPDANFVREALKRCNFVVVSDCIAETDSATYAHVKLPALGWGEKDGTVTNSERVISRQRPIFPPPSEARADWDIISDVARRMGFAQAFDYTSPASVFREYAAQTGFRNGGKRLLDISQWAEISDADYNSWKPWQWAGPSPLSEGRYSTPDGKARLVPVKTPQAETADHAFPLRLNTGRYRDQWHTMTRTGLSPKLSQHRREPWVEIHPEDSARFGIENYTLARVATASGESLYRAMVTDSQREGELFVPMHWTDQISSGGRTGRLPGQKVDLVSGQPAFKNTSASIAPYGADWRGFIVSRDRPDIAADCYWTRVRGEHGWLVELAGHGAIDIEALLPQGERIEAQDAKRGTLRVAVRDEAGVLKRRIHGRHYAETFPPPRNPSPFYPDTDAHQHPRRSDHQAIDLVYISKARALTTRRDRCPAFPRYRFRSPFVG